MTPRFLRWSVPDGMTIQAYRRHVADARERWESGTLPPGVVPQWLVDSWAAALHDARSAGTRPPVPRDPRRMRLVLTACREVLEDADQGMVAVADGRALVHEVWGNPVVRQRCEQVGLSAGVLWDIPSGGLNALGYVAAHRTGCVIFADQHGRRNQADLACSAFPIFFRDQLLAIVNITDLWQNLHPSTPRSLGLLAERVTEHLARDGRRETARMRAAAGWPERITGPALLVDRDGVVVDAHQTLLMPGDMVTLAGDQEAGRCWVPELGWWMWQPLYGADGWLALPYTHGDRTDLPVTLDFARPDRACHVSVRPTVVRWEQTVSEPQHGEILRVLSRHRDGVTATELADALFGDAGRAAQARVLICRLRKQIGGLLAVDQSPPNSQARYRFAHNVILTVRDFDH
jgi:hypothetical protein